MVNLDHPVFVRVTTFVLLLPIATVPKSTLEGLALSVPLAPSKQGVNARERRNTQNPPWIRLGPMFFTA
jgi:hypothetical protein